MNDPRGVTSGRPLAITRSDRVMQRTHNAVRGAVYSRGAASCGIARPLHGSASAFPRIRQTWVDSSFSLAAPVRRPRNVPLRVVDCRGNRESLLPRVKCGDGISRPAGDLRPNPGR